MERWVQMISRDKILKVIGKSKLFTLLKYLSAVKKNIFPTNLHHYYQMMYFP